MKSVRSFFFWLHLAAGCAAGIVILVMSVLNPWTAVIIGQPAEEAGYVRGRIFFIPGKSSG